MATITVAQAATRIQKFADGYHRVVAEALRLELLEIVNLARKKYFRRRGRRGPKHIVSRTRRLENSFETSVKIRSEYIEGVIRLTAPYAAAVHDGSRAHTIRPRRRRVLRWVDESGGIHFARLVHHPGTKPRPVIIWAGNDRLPKTTKEIGKAVAREWHRRLQSAT